MERIAALATLRDKVKAGDDAGFRRANRAAFSTPCQDLALQLREEHCRHAYKGSLDAAKALHESVLPKGEGWEIYRTGKYPGMIPGSSPYKYAASVGYGTKHQASDDNPARAWLLAMLEALIAQESTEQRSTE